MIYFIIIIAILVIAGLIFYKLYLNHIEFKIKYAYDSTMSEISSLVDSYNKYKETNDCNYYVDTNSFLILFDKLSKITK
jgi:hypothetical protein